MILNLFPTYAATSACDATACGNRRFGVAACKVQRCAHAWARIAAEDRQARDLADAKAKADAVTTGRQRAL